MYPILVVVMQCPFVHIMTGVPMVYLMVGPVPEQEKQLVHFNLVTLKRMIIGIGLHLGIKDH